MRVPWCLWPFGRKSKRRRERSERKSTRKGTFPERGERTARTTDGERRHMFDLYEQGLGTHAIAKKRDVRHTRSTRCSLTAAPGRCPSGTQSPSTKKLIAVPVEVAGDADAGNGTTAGRLTGAGI